MAGEFPLAAVFRAPAKPRFLASLGMTRSYGSLTGFDALKDQQLQFFPAVDVDFGPQWEFNFGVGVGTTRSTDHLIVKCIIGRRFSWPHSSGAKLKSLHQ